MGLLDFFKDHDEYSSYLSGNFTLLSLKIFADDDKTDYSHYFNPTAVYNGPSQRDYIIQECVTSYKEKLKKWKPIIENDLKTKLNMSSEEINRLGQSSFFKRFMEDGYRLYQLYFFYALVDDKKYILDDVYKTKLSISKTDIWNQIVQLCNEFPPYLERTLNNEFAYKKVYGPILRSFFIQDAWEEGKKLVTTINVFGLPR